MTSVVQVMKIYFLVMRNLNLCVSDVLLGWSWLVTLAPSLGVGLAWEDSCSWLLLGVWVGLLLDGGGHCVL